MSKSRKISLDLLKITAICLIIYNHTGSNGYELFKYGSTPVIRGIAIFLNTICKAGVGLFFMVSGALLLGKKETLKDVLLKRVLHYFLILIIFSFIYYIRFCVLNPEYGFSIRYFATYIYSHPFITPFWFLYLYIAFLIMLPFLRLAAENIDGNTTLYMLLLVMLFCFKAIPERIFHLEPLNISIGLLQTNIVYPILGYAIANAADDKYFDRKHLYIGSVFLLFNNIISVFMTFLDNHAAAGAEPSVDYMSCFAVFPTIFIFYAFVYFERNNEYQRLSAKVKSIISYIGGCSLYIFLLEEMLRIDIFINMFKITDSEILKWIICVPYSLCIVLTGVLASSLLRKIPVIGKGSFFK